MNLKTVICLIFSFFVGSADASSWFSRFDFFNGADFFQNTNIMQNNDLFIGMQSGYRVGRVDGKMTLKQNNNLISSEAVNMTPRMVPVAVLAGWGMPIACHFYLGIIGVYDFNNHRDSTGENIMSLNQTLNNTYNRRFRNTYRFDIMPGIYLPNHALLYLHGGFTGTQYELSAETTDNQIDPAARSALSGWQSFKKNLHGFDVGVGIKANINLCWAIHAEYTFSRYQRMTHQFTEAQYNAALDNRVSFDEIVVGLTYNIL